MKWDKINLRYRALVSSTFSRHSSVIMKQHTIVLHVILISILVKIGYKSWQMVCFSVWLRWLLWLIWNWFLRFFIGFQFLCNLLILIKLCKIWYLNWGKGLLFPRNQVFCLKNWKPWQAPTTIKFNIF